MLHFAGGCGSTALELVQVVAERWHGGLDVRDAQAFLPFHIAAAKAESLDVVYFLVRALPRLIGMVS